LNLFKAILNLRAALPVPYPAFHGAFCLLDTSRGERDGLLKVVTRPDANGVRIGIQDPLEDAACSIPAVGTHAPQEEPRTWAQVPIPSVGIPSGWASAVSRRNRWFRLFFSGWPAYFGSSMSPASLFISRREPGHLGDERPIFRCRS